jgi:hypothetical protein
MIQTLGAELDNQRREVILLEINMILCHTLDDAHDEKLLHIVVVESQLISILSTLVESIDLVIILDTLC